MEMFALEEEVLRLQAQLGPCLAQAQDHPISAEQLQDLVQLAWYLRQSDTRQALKLVHRAEIALTKIPVHHAPPMALDARLKLVNAEAHWLAGDFESASALAEQAGIAFQELQDPIGLADMHWLNGNIALDCGDAARRYQERSQCARQAGLADDVVRLTVAHASLAVEDIMRDTKMAIAHWQGRLPTLEQADKRGIAACARVWVADYLGIAASTHSDFGQAALFWIQTYDGAIRTGQVKRAIVAATNIGDAFNSLNEHQAALDWMQRGLELAREHNWPTSIALSQVQTAETMRRLGRLEGSDILLQEAISTLRHFGASRNYANALRSLADLRLNQRDCSGALAIFQQLQERADALGHLDFQIAARRGQADALANLGQIRPAFEIAMNALEMARKAADTYNQMDVSCVLAAIYADDKANAQLPQPQPMQGHSPCMHYLLQACHFAKQIDGFTVSPQVLTDLAREYAKWGQFEMAWRTAEEATAAREKTHNEETTQRAIAMQIQHQTMQARSESEKARAESEHHQQMAALEANRALALQKNGETLERLSAIGQEITAQLDISIVFEALNRHVHGLLDVATFIILLLAPDGQRLVNAFSRENGEPLGDIVVNLDNMSSDSARCFRERCEILRDYGPDDETPNLIPNSLYTLSALYAPLAIGEQVLGVMTIQSLQRFAYGERERLIFRTLCAYGAIALDNAHAYRQLQQAQNHLVAQEKLAALGAMVAGVAHELNTPLGNCLMITSSLQEKTEEIARKVASPALQRADLLEFMQDVNEASSVLMRGLSSAADLVSSFKQVAVDRTTAQRRRFELQQTCHEIISTMMNQIKISGHQISMDVPPDIWLESYPGPLGQVITNMINNAMLHAFDGREMGRMHLSAQLLNAETVEIRFRDDGAGITEHNLRHIFDPFFTTKMGQGGTGLGLSISFNIVTSLLNGHIHVESTPHVGTCFILQLPLLTAAPPPL